MISSIRKELASRELAQRELLRFTHRFHKTYDASWCHTELSDIIDTFTLDVEAGKEPRLIVTFPPRHGKSTLLSDMYPCQLLGRHPEWEVIVATYNQTVADMMGRKVRDRLNDRLFQDLFSIKLDDKSNAVDLVKTSVGGMFKSTGVGGSLTSLGANVLIIDDPIKDRAAADSLTERENLWDWYTSAARTRLLPGGGIIVIHCMTGDTGVLMADGAEKALRDIRAGDSVATYEKGGLTTALVKNWVNHGPDLCLAITMKSGTVVKANKRHPFLVDKPEGATWTKVKDLKPGDHILRACAARKAHGRMLPVSGKDAASLCHAKDTAQRITTRGSGPVDTGQNAAIPTRAEKPTSSTATESHAQTSTECSQSKTDYALSVGSHLVSKTPHQNGEDCALTIATIQKECEDCCVTYATSQLDTGEPKKRCSLPLSMYAIEADAIVSIEVVGYEDVFDIEVERTENFIANGLVSHNTRWHVDDLIGRLLKAQQNPEADQWQVYEFPAIAKKDEKYRKAGEALHPARYPVRVLKKIKATLPARDWEALYQCSPFVESGSFFKREFLKWYDELPKDLNYMVGGDYATKAKAANDATAIIPAGLAHDKRIYIHPDFIVDRLDPMDAVLKTIRLMKDLKTHSLCHEKGVIANVMEPLFKMGMESEKHYLVFEKYTRSTGKHIHAMAIRGMIEAGIVYFPRSRQADIERYLLQFMPEADGEDDFVDALASIGIALQKSIVKPPPPKLPDLPESSLPWVMQSKAFKQALEDRKRVDNGDDDE